MRKATAREAAMTMRKNAARGAGVVFMVAIACALLMAGGGSAAAESPQDRRNKIVAQSIYNSGKFAAAKWGERSALALCAAPLDDNEAQADARDEAPTIDDFKDWLRDAYGTHYERYSHMIEPLLDLREHDQRFKTGQDHAAKRLVDNECSPAIVHELTTQVDTALNGLRISMERMAATLSVR
jgi:hypothetical protein